MLSNVNYPEPKLNFHPGIDSVPDGLAADELPVGTVLEAETGHHTYCIENLGNGDVLISGNPQYCPEPVRVMFMRPISRGMRMQFLHPEYGMVSTSRVLEIRKPLVSAIGRA